MIKPLQSPITYRMMTSLLSSIIPVWLRRRAQVGKEDPKRLSERFGRATALRPEGELVWLHGASVGETQMLRPLIDRLLEKPDRHILVTSGTVTSAELLADQLPDRAFHQYLPVDTPRATARFIAYWLPSLAVFAESELWPNLIWTAERAHIPLALISARMSEASLSGWTQREVMARRVLDAFDLIVAADSRTAQGLSRLTGTTVSQAGSLKLDAPVLGFDPDEHDRLRAAIGERPVWLAASTHEAEEAVFFDLQDRLRSQDPDSFLIWLPRHPDRGPTIAERLGAPLRSRGETPNPESQAFVMDTLGEMGLALALADICVLGGSFHDSLMGHNPLEAARAGVPVISGPNIASFADLYHEMHADKAVCIVPPDALVNIVADALAGALTHQSEAATWFAQSQSGALDYTTAELERLIQSRYEDDDPLNGALS